MNSSQIVQNMISFIEKKEKDIQAAKAVGDVKLKSDVVNQILTELEKQMRGENHENQQVGI